MWQFILKRTLLIIPTVFLVLSIIFIFTKIIPGDPVLAALNGKNFTDNAASQAFHATSYNQMARNLNLDKPQFYFSVVPSNFPAELFKLDLLQRHFARRLFTQYGHPQLTLSLVHGIDSLLSAKEEIPRNILSQLARYSADLEYLNQLMSEYPNIEDYPGLSKIERLISELATTIKRDISPVPKLVWHGSDNQYHHWIKNTLLFKFGKSNFDGRPVSKKIYSAFRWTMVINIVSILIGYLVAIIIGVYAGWKGGTFDKLISLGLYFVYSIPVFWLATILVIFFTTPEYGNWTNIFPSVGIWRVTESDTFLQAIRKNYRLFTIPILVLSMSLLAYISRIVRNSVSEEKNKMYVQFARTKGLSERHILWKHVFRNASFPLITLLASVLPAVLAGSIVIEVICNVPGSGRLLYDSIQDHDWNIVNGIVMIYTMLTVIGMLLSDILYRWIDPRVKWSTV